MSQIDEKELDPRIVKMLDKYKPRVQQEDEMTLSEIIEYWKTGGVDVKRDAATTRVEEMVAEKILEETKGVIINVGGTGNVYRFLVDKDE